MKFGIFYELQLPRPWEPDSEQELYNNALDQVLRTPAPTKTATATTQCKLPPEPRAMTEGMAGLSPSPTGYRD